jgi:hypothetical protein
MDLQPRGRGVDRIYVTEALADRIYGYEWRGTAGANHRALLLTICRRDSAHLEDREADSRRAEWSVVDAEALRTPWLRRPRPVDRWAVKQRYESGASLKACGAKFGMSVKDVRTLLCDFGVEIRPGKTVVDNQALCAFYESGATLKACEAKFGISVQRARTRLRALGVEIRPRCGVREADEDEALCALYKSGASLKACGEMFGMSVKRTRTRLCKAGVAIGPPGRPKRQG